MPYTFKPLCLKGRKGFFKFKKEEYANKVVL